MKWLLLGLFSILVVWTALAYITIPDHALPGETVLTWVSDDNPARRGTIRLFEDRHLEQIQQWHPDLIPELERIASLEDVARRGATGRITAAFAKANLPLPRQPTVEHDHKGGWTVGDHERWYLLREQNGALAVYRPSIRVLLDPGNTGVEKVIVQCKGGVGPDIFNVYTFYHLLDYARTGVLLPVTGEAQRMGFGPDETWPQIKDEMGLWEYNPETGQDEYVQYTFPANVNANVIFFNKAVFDEVGEPYPTGDWTWDEFLAVARKLTLRDEQGKIVRYGIGTFEMLETCEMIWQYGGRLFDPTLTYCTMDTPEVIEAVTFLHRMIVQEKVMPSVAARNAMGTAGGWGGSHMYLFANGRIGMLRIGRWAMVTFRQFPQLKGQIGATHLPYKREKVGIVRAMTVGVNPESPRQDAALEFLQFLASEDFSWQVVESADALPPSPKVMTDPGFLHDPHHPKEDFNPLFLEAIQRGRNLRFPPFIQGMRAQKIIDFHLALLCQEGKHAPTPERVCRDMTAEINRDIRTNLIRYESMREEYRRRTGVDFDPDNFPPREVRP